MGDHASWYLDDDVVRKALREARRRRGAPPIDGYEDLRELTRGGQGVVYTALQRSTGRRVAVKVLLDGAFASDEARRRFDRGIELAAALQHPGIVRLHDGGCTADGRQYLVMELIDGPPLDEYLSDRSIEQRVEMIARIADAVHHAHQRGVLHRDLKPSNVRIDAAGDPHVLDFGAARPVSRRSGDTLSTPGQFVGSLPWASPEHARGETDVRSDIYSLGVMLYHALTGCFPYDIDGDVYETLRHIVDTPPRRPRDHDPRIHVELEQIVLKALAKAPDARQQSASELAEQLRRYLRGDPVGIQPVSQVEHLRLFVRRHRAVCAGAAAVLVVSLAGTAISTMFAMSARRAQREAEREQYVSTIAAAEASLRSGDIATARQWLEEAPEGLREWWEWRHLDVRVDASLETLVEGPEPLHAVTICPIDGCTLAASGLDGSVVVRSRTRDGWREAYELEVGAGAFVRDIEVRHTPSGGRWIIVAGGDGAAGGGVVRAWEMTDDGVIPDVFAPLRTQAHVYRLAVDRHTDLIATVEPEAIRLWTRTGAGAENVATFQPHLPFHTAVALNDDGDRLVAGGDDYTASVWNVADPAAPVEIARLRGHAEDVKDVAFVPGNDRVLASASVDGTVRVWQVPSGAPRPGEVAPGILLDTLRGHRGGLYSIAFSSDGRTLAAAGVDPAIWIWQAGADGRHSSRERAILAGHGDTIRTVAFGPGHELASASNDGTVRLWSAAAPDVVPVLGGHRSSVNSVAFVGADSGLIASACGDWVIRLWDVERCDELGMLMGHGGPVHAVAGDPRGDALYSVSTDGTTRRWDLANVDALGPSSILPAGQHDRAFTALAVSPSGDWVVAGDADGTLFAWDVTGAEPVLRHRLPGTVAHCNVVAVNDRDLVVAGFGYPHTPRATGAAIAWNMRTGRDLQLLPHDGAVTAAAFCPDAPLLVTGTVDGALVTWRRRGRLFQRLDDVRAHAAAVASIEFQPGSTQRRFATASRDRTHRVWTLEDDGLPRMTASLRGHLGPVSDVAFSRDGQTLATASLGFEGTDNVVKLWETAASDDRRRARARERHRAALIRQTVEPIVETHGGSDEIVAAVEQAELSPEQRRAALRMARFRRTPPLFETRDCWSIVKHAPDPDGSAAEYRTAHARMKQLVELLPERITEQAEVMLTFGLAAYRVEHLQEARRALTEADALATDGDFFRPAIPGVLALALHALEAHEQACVSLRRAAVLAKGTAGRARHADQEAVRLVEEAERTLARCSNCAACLSGGGTQDRLPLVSDDLEAP